MFKPDLQQNKYYSWLVARICGLFTGLREATGDAAYEKYIQHCSQHHPGTLPLNRKAFYQQRLEQKWTGVNRCC